MYRNVFLTVLLICTITIFCYSQVEYTVSVGAVKNLSAFHHMVIKEPGGELKTNEGASNLSAGIHASIPLNNSLRLQAGIRVLFDQGYLYKLHFNYPNQFSFTNHWVSWGTAIEMPVSIIYELPNEVLGRNISFNLGMSLAKNKINRLSVFQSQVTDIFTPPPNSIAYSINAEVIESKNFLTPGIEIGTDIFPLIFRNFGIKLLYHYDLIPSFGGLKYQNKFHFASGGPFVQDEPEGIIRAKRTSYFLVHLSYRLPFFDRKNKEVESIDFEEAEE